MMRQTTFAVAVAAAVVGWTTPDQIARADAYVIESNTGGQHYDRYSETYTSVPWQDSTGKSTAGGLTASHARWAGTNHSDYGEMHAIFTPDLPQGGLYEVFATWGPNVNGQLRDDILHRITYAGGVADVDVDQSATANEWVSLGQYPFYAGTGGSVDVSNLHIDTIGVMYADAVKWEFVLQGAYFSVEGEFPTAGDQVDFHTSLLRNVDSSESLYFQTFGGGSYGGTNAAGDTFMAGTKIDSVLAVFDSAGQGRGYDDDYPGLGWSSMVTWVDSDTPLNPDPLPAGDYRLNLSEYGNDDPGSFAVDLVGPADAVVFNGASLTNTAKISSLKLGTIGPGTAIADFSDHSLTVEGPLVVANTGSAQIWIGGGQTLTVQGATTINPGGYVNMSAPWAPDGALDAQDNVTVDGGTLTGVGSHLHLAPGKLLNAQNDGQIAFHGRYDLEDDTTFTIQSGADLGVSGALDIGVDEDGTLVVNDEGSSLTTNIDDPAPATWGANGGTANVTVKISGSYSGNPPTADIGAEYLQLAPDDDPASRAAVLVDYWAEVTLNSLYLANSPEQPNVAAGTAEFTVDHYATVTQRDDSVLVVGGPAGGGTALLKVDYDCDFITGTGGVTVNPTGTIELNSGLDPGVFYANGDVTIDGGTLTGRALILATGITLTAKNEGQLGMSYYGYWLNDDTTATIQSGADFTVEGPLDIGYETNGTLVVEGAGSTMTTNTVSSATLSWGYLGGTANVTIRDNAVADVGADIYMAADDHPGPISHAFVNVDSGAGMTVDGLYLLNGAVFGAVEFTVTGRDLQTGSPSTVTQREGSDLVVGGLGGEGSATLTVENGAQFHSGTGDITVLPTGAINVGSNGIFHANGDVLISDGAVHVTAASFHADNRAVTITGGTLKASNAGLITAGSVDVWPQGTIELDGGTVSLYGSTEGINLEGTLSGSGSVMLSPGEALLNIGSVSPGGADAAGLITIYGGRYQQDSDGELLIELGGTDPAEYDRLHVEWAGSEIVLGGGALNVVPIEADGGMFQPGAGDTFEILAGTSITGYFASMNLPPLAGDLYWDVLQDTDSLTLKVRFPGDYNGNGIVDAADYTVWRDSYSGPGVPGNPDADGDRDGDVDENDCLFWKTHFGRIAPGGGAGASPAVSAAVPEPSGAGLLTLAAIGLLTFLRPRR